MNTEIKKRKTPNKVTSEYLSNDEVVWESKKGKWQPVIVF